MYKIEFYKTPRGEYPVRDFIEKMEARFQMKIYGYISFLQEKGHNLKRPYTARVKGKIRELRIRISAGNVRIFYFFFLKNKIILLHAVKKKTQKLPLRDIEKAESNMNDFINCRRRELK